MRMTLRHYICSTRRNSRRCPGKSFLLPCLLATGQANDWVDSNATVESQHSIGAPTCHDFPRFVTISDKSRSEVGNRWLWSSKTGSFLEKGRNRGWPRSLGRSRSQTWSGCFVISNRRLLTQLADGKKSKNLRTASFPISSQGYA